MIHPGWSFPRFSLPLYWLSSGYCKGENWLFLPLGLGVHPRGGKKTVLSLAQRSRRFRGCNLSWAAVLHLSYSISGLPFRRARLSCSAYEVIVNRPWGRMHSDMFPVSAYFRNVNLVAKLARDFAASWISWVSIVRGFQVLLLGFTKR